MAGVPSTAEAQKPEKQKPETQDRPRVAKTRSLIGSTLPYLAAAIFAAGIMAWYFFVFVPAKLDYFVGLRFRTLAVASAQVASKEESLFTALRGAVVPKGTRSQVRNEDVRGYFKALVPDMRFSREGTKDLSPERVPGLRLLLDVGGKEVGATVEWEDVVQPAAEASTRDFDDLILAREDGVVVWQRETATPRVTNLTELYNTEPVPAGWFSFSWQVRPSQRKAKDKERSLPHNAELVPVEVGGVPSYLFLQPVRLADDGPKLPPLYVAGLVSRHEVERQATHIPVVWVVFLTLPVVLLFLALPYIKLVTLLPKERYAFADIALLSFATIWVVGIGASLPFGPAASNDRSDEVLEHLAKSIERRLAIETRRVLDLAGAIQDHETELRGLLENCQSYIEPIVGTGRATEEAKRCDLWKALKILEGKLTGSARTDLGALIGSLELDIVAWVDREGQQVQKWTTKTVVTTLTSHRAYAHFRNLAMGHTWKLADAGQPSSTSPPFTIEPLRSPTTAEMGFIFGVPATGTSHRDQFVVLNVRPQSVVDPILPPGYGFAVLAQDGSVQFHSEEALSLKENFLEEIDNPNSVRAWLQSGHQLTWNGDYHGRPHRIHMRTLPLFVGCQWRIVVLQEMQPALATLLQQQTATLRLWLLNFLVLLGALGVFWWRSRASFRKVRDIMLCPGSTSRPGMMALIVLTVFATVLIVRTYQAGAFQQLDYVYAGFVVIPIAAIVVAIASRYWKRWVCNSLGGGWGAGEVLLLLLLVGVIPAIGFARIAYRLHDANDTATRLERTTDNWETRRVRVQDRVNGPASPREDARITTGRTSSPVVGITKWQPERKGEEKEPLHSYVAEISGTTLGTSVPAASGSSGGPTLLPFLLEWTPFRTKDHPRIPAPTPTTDRSKLELAPHDPQESPMLSTAVDSRGTGALSLVRIVIGVLILVTAGIALCWARRRLIVPSFLAGPTLAHQISHVLSGGAKEILLVGPPRTRKDEAVIKAVRRATGKAPAERIRLLDKELTNDYIESEVARINLLASENNGARLAPDGRLWIHISNLESQLMNATSRTQVLKLLEQLREGRDDLPQKVLVVTTSVDPIANFEEVFDTERKGVYDDVIPEVGLSRSSLILSRFLRCYVPILCDKSADKRWQKWLNYRPEDWKDTLALEAEGYEPLLEIAAELARCEWTDGHPSLDELARAFTARAQATYQLLWTSCTRSEKLVLIQLAQEGLVNPKCHDVVARLMAKGMVVSKPGLTVFNYTFRQFLRGIERDQVVTEWERVEGTGLWVTAGRLVGSGLLAGGLFFLLTQDLSVQSLLPIISGTGVFGLPIVRELMAYFSSRSSDAPRAA